MAGAYELLVKNHPNLIGLWRLADADPTAVETLGVHPGTYSGGYTQEMPAHHNKAVLFATGGSVTIPDHAQFDGLTALTLEAWIYADSGATYTVVSKSGAFGFTLAGSLLSVTVYTTTPATRTGYFNNLPTKRWVHICIGWKGSSPYFFAYADGIPLPLYTTTGGAGTTVNNANPVVITGNGLYVQDVAIYNAELSAGAVLAHTHSGYSDRNARHQMRRALISPNLTPAPVVWPGSRLRANVQENPAVILRPVVQVNTDIVRH